ncbi:MAG: tyrosine--tRNA ligase [Actinomycetota bacterium]
MPPTLDEQLRTLTWNAAEVVPADALADKLRSGRPLRVKLGLDPTADHVTLGWSVVLRKLRSFQELGHTAVLIVGDFTARIGDPSELDKTRPMLTKEQVDEHAQRVLDQFFSILDEERTEVRRNSEWLEALGVAGLLELASHQTVAHTLGRDDFARRYASGAPISLREFIYPLLQGYDSVAVQADVEIGGTDQHFNLLVGRDLQRAMGQDPQAVLTMPLIEGTDGVRKMAQSLGNYIGITEPAEEIFGKVMSIPDELMGKYFRLATDRSEADIAAMERENTRPEQLKRALARDIVRLYHGEEAAEAAALRFDEIFVEDKIPDDVPENAIPDTSINGGSVYVPRLLSDLGLAESTSAGRRLISQGGVYIDGARLDSEELELTAARGRVVSVGKRRFVRLM